MTHGVVAERWRHQCELEFHGTEIHVLHVEILVRCACMHRLEYTYIQANLQIYVYRQVSIHTHL